mmetsp:Transcript_103797/g.178824  ORF Transcript_103797/g.178824 Transcript_103797/m.178824 type:complete len:103 (-) Transcript_103797:207-515(-)
MSTGFVSPSYVGLGFIFLEGEGEATNLNPTNPTDSQPAKLTSGSAHMVSLYFELAESIPGLGSPIFLGFEPTSGAKQSGPDTILGHMSTRNRPPQATATNST